jgi:hypothetical protein
VFPIDAGGDHSLPAVSGAKKDFVVTWRDSGGVHGAAQSVRAQRFDRHGHVLGAPIVVESGLPASQPVFYAGPWVEAASDGRFAVSWEVPGPNDFQNGTAFLRQYTAAGAPESAAVALGSGADSIGLGGFAADDNLAHGMVVWESDSHIVGQFVADPAAAAPAAGSSANASDADDDSTAATDLLFA